MWTYVVFRPTFHGSQEKTTHIIIIYIIPVKSSNSDKWLPAGSLVNTSNISSLSSFRSRSVAYLYYKDILYTMYVIAIYI